MPSSTASFSSFFLAYFLLFGSLTNTALSRPVAEETTPTITTNASGSSSRQHTTTSASSHHHTFHPPTDLPHTFTRSFSFGPPFIFPTGDPTSPSHPLTDPPHPPPHRPPNTTLIAAVAVICGGLAIIILIFFGRCLVRWTRTPTPPRAMTTADREQLIREMQEYAQSAHHRNRTSLYAPPPPPYEPAPDYDEESHTPLTCPPPELHSHSVS
ncbi:hypothetical protein BV25DRAFT_1910353 [Artomyces pyxidatus]|uniref:Uncharacterized protein n=1 Tax=Artomyces pyxidatus TaxID=48021 RepID=A0ACB8TJL3_9AGAM|nr:hypothetical protein BV25DRAFT_1910353 [Artomyces pyxidatus]